MFFGMEHLYDTICHNVLQLFDIFENLVVLHRISSGKLEVKFSSQN
ncbi:hypothetical protein HMPREF0372_04085 [Flavonifractor plautii ATCC 29863]|uniref:Uncharacterized protein n=1 Tax=Flavonifractor plautii ATCC 29863 TaxID=411475 RepID=G9YX17_FLAPL|nr:hypothetical protein HMPREF0372_04085 [Flavonifractor plautii ATCC 29863]